MPTEEEILEYYKSNKFNPILPINTKFKHFRFKLWDKGWKKVTHSNAILSKDDLKNMIIKLKGCDIYYSTSSWLNPEKISVKGNSGNYLIADNLLLKHDLVFDIDAEKPITMEGLEKAKQSAKYIYNYMKKHTKEYKFDYFSFTGMKGFRLAYEPIKQNLDPDPRKRIPLVIQERKVFIEQMLKDINKEKKNNIKTIKSKPVVFFDKEITINIMCVVRVLGTIHSITGFVSSKLPLKCFNKSIKEILNNVPYVGKKRPVIPYEREMKMTGPSKEVPRPRLLISGRDVPGLASYPNPHNIGFQYFTTNKVIGAHGLFIPVFIYQKTSKFYKSEVKKLQKNYELGTLYVFEKENEFIIISLKCMQKRQLQKLLNQSKSSSKHLFKKHKKIQFPYYMKNINSFKKKINGQISKGHYYYLNKEYPKTNYAGWGHIEIIKGILRERK